MTSIYLEYSHQLNRSRFQEKSCVTAFLIRNLCSKTIVFLTNKAAKFLNRSKKSELILKVEFGRLVFFIIFTRRKGFAITCLIPRSGRWARNHFQNVYLSRPSWNKSRYIGGKKIVPSRFLPRPDSHVNRR